MNTDYIEQAISVCGTQLELARRITEKNPLKPVSYQAIQGWRKFGRVPAERAVQIEQVTNGEVTRHDLRPDLFDNKAA